MIHTDAIVIHSEHKEGRYVVSVADGIEAINMATVSVTGPGEGGNRAVLWQEVIQIERTRGWPVKHTRYDGEVVDYGGPSHAYHDMAQKRARDLLEARIHEARSIAMGHAIQAGIAARRAMRAAAGEG